MKYLSSVILITISFISLGQPLSPMVDSIPMRDNKKIAADIYIPSGCTQCPVILIQTPYNRLNFRWSLPLGVGVNINSSNYIFVTTDWRGFFGSSAAVSSTADQGEDGYDVIDWIASQTWCDGNVGTFGPSALGKVQYTTAREQHPNHICAVPQVAGPQFAYNDHYYGGVLEESHLEQLDALGFGLSPIVLAHPTKDLIWTIAESSTFYPDSIVIPMLIQGGWYDHATRNELEWFDALKASSPAASEHKILIGPWVHGGTGVAYLGSSIQGELTYPSAAGITNVMAMDFFDYHLRGLSNGWDTIPDVTYFQMGENTWQSSSQWPTADVSPHVLYLHSGGLLLQDQPSGGSGSVTYNYDPKDPSPTIGGSTLHPTLDQGPYDQAPLVESRNDIAIFNTITLGQDVVMKGQLKAHLKVSSNRKDTDFAIRLTDVYPDGRSMLITDGIRRLRFRNGYAPGDTAVAVPGQVYDLEITLPPTSYTFEAGHRIRIDITSSNSRRWDTNLNNGGAMYTAGDTLIATNTVYHNSINPSYIDLPVVDFAGSVGENSSIAWNAFPNPVVDNLNILTDEPSDLIELFSYDGRLLMSRKPLSNFETIDMSELSSGPYILSLTTEAGVRVTKILIKQ